MQVRLTGRATLALLAALVMLTSAAPALAQATTGRALQQAEPFSWWMEPRYELGWRLYDPATASYPADYLYPQGWQVGFDACDSPLAAGHEVASYRWHVEGIEHIYSFDSEPGASCRLDTASVPAAPALPVEGLYIVTVTLTFADGNEVTGSLQIAVEDLLIVSLGDSNASGEGNPHVNQAGGLRPADDIWFDRRCHRSANSGHAMAAAAIEANDPHTAVTFLSFACSGAEVWSGLVSGYDGIEPPGDSTAGSLDPQLLALMKHLCQATETPSCIENPRQVDSLFVSIGVNDLGFAAVLLSCAGEQSIDEMVVEDLFIPGVVDAIAKGDWETLAYYGLEQLLDSIDPIVAVFDWLLGLFGKDFLKCGEELDPVLDMNLTALWAHYRLLDRMFDGEAGDVAAELRDDPHSHFWMSPSVRTRFLNLYGALPAEMTASIAPRAVYITSYPADPFQDEFGRHDGCGFFGRIDGGEAAWIGEQGRRLNQHMAWAAEAHRWHYVDGITAGFAGHGYCAGDQNYYVRLSDSLLSQYNYQGALHPNLQGHAVTRDRLLDAYYAEKPDWRAKHRLTVKLEAVRIGDNRENPQSQATFTAKVYDEWYRHEHMIDQLEVPVGDWYSLPDDGFTFSADLADDDVIKVLAHTSLGGGLFYPPKCHSPECAQIIEPTRLATSKDYALANHWGGDYEWCDYQPTTKFFVTERLCSVRVNQGDFALDVRYRIVVINLAAAGPYLPPGPGDQVVCGPHCEPEGVTPYTSIAEYLERLEAAGEDVAVVAALLDYLDQQVVAD